MATRLGKRQPFNRKLIEMKRTGNRLLLSVVCSLFFCIIFSVEALTKQRKSIIVLRKQYNNMGSAIQERIGADLWMEKR